MPQLFALKTPLYLESLWSLNKNRWVEREMKDGIVFSKRALRQQKTKWIDNIQEGAKMRIVKVGRADRDRDQP